MRKLAGTITAGLSAGAVLALISCGGGGGGGSTGSATTPTSNPINTDPIANAAANVQTVTVDAGPANSVNTLFITVTICAPGSTANCKSIDHIQVDTGSSGLRLMASVIPSLALPLQTDAGGNALVECLQFIDGYSWGPVALADLTISGESARSLPVQIIGDARFTAVPAACSGTGPAENTVQTFGANGVLGIGVFVQDCGPACVSSATQGFYYTCSTAQCTPTTATLTQQVQNPVSSFGADGNGVIIQLPSVAAQGQSLVTGAIVFGVDTQNNNASGSAKVLTLDPNTGNLTTVFNGQNLNQSFFDSGSNGLFFTDSALTQCSSKNSPGFYCPATTQPLSATARGANGASSSISFSIANADSLGATDATLVAFPTLGGTNPTAGSFDWGLPFFFGRNVYTVFENKATSAGTGPYVAF